MDEVVHPSAMYAIHCIKRAGQHLRGCSLDHIDRHELENAISEFQSIIASRPDPEDED